MLYKNYLMLSLLKTHFGYSAFRPLQEDIINNVISGNDTFVLMPTGGGKSLCYQLPALYFSGITLVISPLIALQKDQVDGLKENGINAEFINSSISFNEIDLIKFRIKKGEIKLLYIAPERFSNANFMDFLKTININLIAIDEAHCISEWGHDFRPDYRNLNLLKENFQNIPIIALTATATERVRIDIINQLKLLNTKIFISSFNRENLNITVIRKKNSYDKLLKLLEEEKKSSIIIYCFSRNDTEELADSLRIDGFNAKAYHGGMNNEIRKNTQEEFIKDKVNIIVATIAFGMGIDKPDVRMVIHFTFPKTLEGYYQEIGRAGRDSLPSKCIMFYSYGDKIKHEFFIRQINDEKERLNAELKLKQVIDYCELQTCKRKYLLKYFGENFEDDNCGNCSVCLDGEKETFNATEITQKILSAIMKTGERFGMNHVINVLRGSKEKQVLQFNHQNLSVYGIVNDFSQDDLRQIVKSLIDLDYIKKNEGQFPTLSLSQKGIQFLKNKNIIYLNKPKNDDKNIVIEGVKQDGALDYNKELFEILRKYRKELADRRNIPPFMIFGDVSLHEMAYYMPIDEENFSLITGVGRQKLNEFGSSFTNIIKKFCNEHGLIPRQNKKQKNIDEKVKKMKGGIDRYEITKNMVISKIPIGEIVYKQGLTIGTIMNHIERLLQNGYKLDIEYLMPEKEIVDKVSNAFRVCGTESLGAVYRYLKEKISYNEIKFVRLKIISSNDLVCK